MNEGAMKVIMQLLFNDDNSLWTIDINEIARKCGPDYTEFEVLRVIQKMKCEKEIEIVRKATANR